MLLFAVEFLLGIRKDGAGMVPGLIGVPVSTAVACALSRVAL